MFFTKGDWIGIKFSKNARFHLHLGFTPTGLSALKTMERSKAHSPIVKITYKELEAGFESLFSVILHNEIDPTDSKFRKWTLLIPRSTSPDSPIAKNLFIEKGRTASMTLTPLVAMGPFRALHELFEVIPLAQVRRRQFKWALAYPTRNWKKFSGRSMRWVHGWGGRYFMISDRKRSALLRVSFRLKS